MKKLTQLVLLFSLFLMAPTTSVMAEMSVEKVTKKIKVEYDKVDRILYLKAPKIKGLKHDPYYLRIAADPEMKSVEIYNIIVEYDFFKSNPGRNSGYVMSVESAYRDFYTARDEGGNSFQVKTIYRDFDGCNDSFCFFDEYFKIELPKEYIDAHIIDGIHLKVLSRAGTYVSLNFYPAYIQGIKTRLAKERRKLGY